MKYNYAFGIFTFLQNNEGSKWLIGKRNQKSFSEALSQEYLRNL